MAPPPTASTPSSHLRPSPAPINLGNGLISPQRSSQAQPPLPMVAGTPPPRRSSATDRRRLWSRCLGPPPREPRAPRGAARSPLPFPHPNPRRRRAWTPKNQVPPLPCSVLFRPPGTFPEKKQTFRCLNARVRFLFLLFQKHQTCKFHIKS